MLLVVLGHLFSLLVFEVIATSIRAWLHKTDIPATSR
jgi:hypothetical protein